jgi:nickel-type superoxide dismutase maturation protease
MRWPLGRVLVQGPSMVPALRSGDQLLVRWRGRQRRSVRPGDVVVVRRPDGLDVKRVQRHEPDGWWVEGDNPYDSMDSRSYGVVPDADVVGRVLVRYWPVRRR